MDFSGKNTEVGCHFLFQGIFWPRNQTRFSCVYHWATRKALQKNFVVVVQLLSGVWLFATPWTAACKALLSFTISWSLLKFMSIESVMLSKHHLSSPSPPALSLSQHQVLFHWVGSLHQVAKVLELHSASASVLPMNIQNWFPLRLTGLISLQSKGLSRVFSSITIWSHQFLSFSFSISPSIEYSKLISFKIDWFDLLAVQGTVKSFL